MSEAAPRDVPHFREFDGLRGYMALWVAITHALNNAGYPRLGGYWNLLTSGNLPVDVFIMLSGFVITHLLITKRESYRIFIFRRFLRLYPLFAVTCFFAFFLVLPRLEYAQAVSWHDMATWLPIIADREAIAQEAHNHLAWHALAHMTMLHGAIPREWLNFADIMFLPPAWSISLEWQFYLLAPLIVTAMQRRIGAIVMIAVALVSYLIFQLGWFGTYMTYSLLPPALMYFLIGIGTRLVWEKPKTGRRPVEGLIISVVLCAVLFANARVPLAIWGTVSTFAYFSKNGSHAAHMLDWALRNRFSDLLGRISYSVYLTHFLVISSLTYWALHIDPNIDRHEMLIVCAIAVALTVPLSMLTYRWIEKPSIDAARRWVA